MEMFLCTVLSNNAHNYIISIKVLVYIQEQERISNVNPVISILVVGLLINALNVWTHILIIKTLSGIL